MTLSERKAVALAVVVRGEEDDRYVLAIRRASEDKGMYWVFPGGKIEPGESARAAAKRELKEETGLLAASRADCIGSRVHPLSHNEVYYIGLRCKSGTLKLEDKFCSAEWVSIDLLTERFGGSIFPNVLKYLGADNSL